MWCARVGQRKRCFVARQRRLELAAVGLLDDFLRDQFFKQRLDIRRGQQLQMVAITSCHFNSAKS